MRWLLPVVVIVAAGVAYRAAYGNWPWSKPPDRLSTCGRRHYLDPGTSRRVPLLHEVLRAPPLVGRRIFSGLTAARRERLEREGEPCGLLLYARAGHGRYLIYALSGGP
jgi:hypothetical protein